MKKSIKKVAFIYIIFGLILVIGGITYAFFNFTAFSNELVTNNGQVYMKMSKNTNNITLNNVFPETHEEALYVNGESGTLRTDNIIEFTVIGKNTYENPIYYEIDLEYGDSVLNKTRIDDKYLKFELLDITDPDNIDEIISNISFDSINNKKIYVETIGNTDINYTRTYRLRMWYDENIIISDTELDADFKASNNDVDLQNQDLILYSDLFASVKVKVYGDFIEKTDGLYTPATCFTYINSGTEISIKGYDISCGTKVSIPVEFDNTPVTTIGSVAFKDIAVTNVKIPKGVTSIGAAAFSGCSSLTKVTIPNSVTSIGGWAFENCTSLTNIVIPNSVLSIDNYAFKNCTKFTNIIIPDSVTIIADGIFYGCRSLTGIMIHKNITSIGYNVFYNCNSLESIIVDSNNTVFDSRNNCNAIIKTSTNELIRGCKNTIIPNGVTSIGEFAFSESVNLISITLPNSIVSIGNKAFCGCSSITNIIIPNSVTSIGNWSFSECDSLISITIPSSVTSIGNAPFYKCNNLESIIVDSNNSIFDSRNNCNAIVKTSTNELIQACMNTIIPNSVISIGKYAFYYQSNITSITIPNSVTKIDGSAFAYCSNLISIEIPNGVTSIGSDAFLCCSNLTSIVIPNTVTSLGSMMFYDCQSLSNIYVSMSNPSNVTYGNDLFYRINNLSSINLHVPSQAVNLYRNHVTWKQLNIIGDN